MTPTTKEIPTIECWREGVQLVFDCPHCWKYGGSFGWDNHDHNEGSSFFFYYRRRPKRAKPVRHLHGVCGPNFGDGDGHRVAHCAGGPLYDTGYYLKEIIR